MISYLEQKKLLTCVLSLPFEIQKHIYTYNPEHGRMMNLISYQIISYPSRLNMRNVLRQLNIVVPKYIEYCRYCDSGISEQYLLNHYGNYCSLYCLRETEALNNPFRYKMNKVIKEIEINNKLRCYYCEEKIINEIIVFMNFNFCSSYCVTEYEYARYKEPAKMRRREILKHKEKKQRIFEELIKNILLIS